MGRIDALIDTHGLGDARAAIKAMLRPSIALVPTPGRGSIGGHRLGGMPDLPLDLDWPTSTEVAGANLAFLLQLNLDDLDLGGLGLPTRGMLWLFIGQDEPATNVEVRVFHREEPGPLLPCSEDAGFPSYASLTPCTLFGARQQALSGLGHHDPRLADLAQSLLGEGKLARASRLGGPLLWHAHDPRLSPYVTHDLGRPDLIWESKRARDKQWTAITQRERREGAERWVPLIQLRSHPVANLSFWDGGLLTVLVRADAARRGDVRVVYGSINLSTGRHHANGG